MTGTKEKIVRNLIWAVIGKIVTLFGSFFVGIIVARYLGPEQYGLMNYVISYVALFQILAIFGLDSIEIREESKHEQRFTTIIGTAFCLKVVFAIITMALVIVTSFIQEVDGYVTLMVCLYSLSMIANSFSVIKNYFTAILQNEYIVKSEIARTVISITFKIALLLLHASLGWFILATTLDTFILAGGYITSYKSKIGSIKQWKFDIDEAKHLLCESYPLMFTSAAVMIYQRIDQVMIGQMIDKEAVGFFSVASRFVDFLIYIPFILADTITPVLVKIREESENRYIERAQRFMNVTFWLSVIAACITSAVSYWLVLYLFSEAYIPSVPILQILAFKAAAVALSTTAGKLIIIEGKQKYAIFRDCFGCFVCVALNLYFLPIYGTIAAAIIAIISNIVAGYISDLFIPPYRKIFMMQTKTIFTGWTDLVHIKQIVSKQ